MISQFKIYPAGTAISYQLKNMQEQFLPNLHDIDLIIPTWSGTWIVYEGSIPVVSNFELRKLDESKLSRGILESENTTVLDTGLLTVGTWAKRNNDYFRVNLETGISAAGHDSGIYQVAYTNDSGSFHSDLFCIVRFDISASFSFGFSLGFES